MARSTALYRRTCRSSRSAAQARLASGRGELGRYCLWLSRVGLRPQAGRRPSEPAGLRLGWSVHHLVGLRRGVPCARPAHLARTAHAPRHGPPHVLPACTRRLLRLVELGVVPVVNENDTVTVDEIKFGDNDTLAALVSCLVSADLCVTLSDIDGSIPPIRTRTPRPSLFLSCIRSMPRLLPRRVILPHRWARAA